MNTQMTLKTVKSLTPVAIILGTPNLRPPTILERAPAAGGAVHSDPQANLDDSTQFREDILRRYEAPFRFEGWLHSGLND
jgi:hypothetical protein